MKKDQPIVPGVSRRRFLATTAAAAAVSALPPDFVWAQTAPSTAKWQRVNVNSAAGAAMLKSYQIGVTKSLALPPSDPRNWYRNAFVHLLDCPHGNWWLLPWHRGYIGWWEQTIRDLSGDTSFAFPYWDWTADPSIPLSMFGNVLDPSNAAFIASYQVFHDQFKDPMSDFWKSLTPAQVTEVNDRGYTSLDVFWNDPNLGAKAAFFPPSQARFHTAANPGFSDPSTISAVSLSTLLDALAPKVFTDFGSDPSAQHSTPSASGILESQPHNLVHNDVGGFMEDFLSPVDPIFFLHHSNIDRIWDVWTRKQQALGLDTLPTGQELTDWSSEPFLFYIDSNGKPVTQNTAGDYSTIGAFNYGYTAGSGEQVVPKAAPMAAAAAKKSKYLGTVQSSALALVKPGLASISVPSGVLESAGTDEEPGKSLFLRVAIDPPEHVRGSRFHVLLNPPADVAEVDFNDPSYVGTIEFFGRPHHVHGSVIFTLPATDAVRDLRAAGRLKDGEPLRVHVIPQTRGVMLKAPAASSLRGVSAGAF
jgi:tyrosinase